MPQLGETVTEGTILSWSKGAGDVIAEDEVLVEISTDKVDTEMPSPASGVVTEILVDPEREFLLGRSLGIGCFDQGDAVGFLPGPLFALARHGALDGEDPVLQSEVVENPELGRANE